MYDFRENTKKTSFVYDEIEKMHPAELERVYDVIFQIREEQQNERENIIKEWFDSVIVPSLIEITKKINGVLDIDEDEKEIVASIRSEGGMEVKLSTGRMRMAIYLADAISIETIADETEIALIYTKESLMK